MNIKSIWGFYVKQKGADITHVGAVEDKTMTFSTTCADISHEQRLSVALNIHKA